MSDDNTISGLRAVLFETLRGLKSGEVKVEQAEAINETAQVIVNTAKVEVDYIRATGQTIDSGFLPSPLPKPGKAGFRERDPGKTIPGQLGESPKGSL